MILTKNEANFTPLSPVSLIKRTAKVYPNYTAIIHKDKKQTWSKTYQRCQHLALALKKLGIQYGDTVSVLLPNILPMVEVHFGIPMAGAILNTLNYRLTANDLAYCINHSSTKILITDTEYSDKVKIALGLIDNKITIINVQDIEKGELIGDFEYESLLSQEYDEINHILPKNEWDTISINYTSGTTGKPKGVVYHHRGAYLNAISNIVDWNMPMHPHFLWTLPMFHCNGWCFPWTLAARAGINICLRQVRIEDMFDKLVRYKADHYCGAPIVHSMFANMDTTHLQQIKHKIKAIVAAAAPPIALISAMDKIGIELTHVYGLTETYGPAAFCVKHKSWDKMSLEEKTQLESRQGFNYTLEEDLTVIDTKTLKRVPFDGKTKGEVAFKGNIVMKGYLNDAKQTKEAFKGGWLHTGDIGVIQPDGYLKILDRAKDIIISGGENISSLEIEDILSTHPSILASAVVAKPNDKWGEIPCAFIELKPEQSLRKEDILVHCRKHLAGFKIPKEIHFDILPRTSTGKIQKYLLRNKIKSCPQILNN